MNALIQNSFADRLPTKIEIDNANQLRKVMTSLVSEDKPTKVKLASTNAEIVDVTLMPAIAFTFLQVLRLISRGKGFRVIPFGAALTTQQAADLLNVSRPFLIKLLEAGEIPFTKTGRHRRIRAEDLFAYKDKRDGERADALSGMARADAESGYL